MKRIKYYEVQANDTTALKTTDYNEANTFYHSRLKTQTASEVIELISYVSFVDKDETEVDFDEYEILKSTDEE